MGMMLVIIFYVIITFYGWIKVMFLTLGTAVDLQTQSPMGSEQEGNESGCVC